MRTGTTLRRATEEWVQTFNAIPQGMIDKLMRSDSEEWHEVTTPSCGDRVYCYNASEYGMIDTIDEDDDGNALYNIELDNGTIVELEADDFEVERDSWLPMWGTMWSFGDSADDYFLEELDGIRIMSECGFRIYESDEFGYFFGIDGCGYSFYEAHWIPLYIRRGMHWHDDEALTEEEKEMIKRYGEEE